MLPSTCKRAYIRSTGCYVPERKVSNNELTKTLDTSDEWIFSHTGIHNRHIAADDQAASDLAVFAADRALENARMKAGEVDLIIVATTTPDFLGFPSTAAIVQHKLGAKHAGAMDLSAACTGFIYGIETARCFIEAGSMGNILVIGSEVYSRIVDWTDRNTCVLFGDGAGAALVSANDGHPESWMSRSLLKADGNGADYLKVLGGGGSSVERDANEARGCSPYIVMAGRKVYTFAVRVICETIERLLEENGLTLDDVSYIIPHQANVRIVEAAGKRMGIPQETFYMNINEFANTSAASIPIAMCEMERKGLLSRGNLVVTIGFGGGLTYGGNIMYW